MVHCGKCLIGILWNTDSHPRFAEVKTDLLYHRELIYLFQLLPMNIDEICFEQLQDSSTSWCHRLDFKSLHQIIQMFPKRFFLSYFYAGVSHGCHISRCSLIPAYLTSMELMTFENYLPDPGCGFSFIFVLES